jgi:hypothetical protein
MKAEGRRLVGLGRVEGREDERGKVESDEWKERRWEG